MSILRNVAVVALTTLPLLSPAAADEKELLAAATVPMARAIEIAEAQIEGGMVVELDLAGKGDAPVWDAVVIGRTQRRELRIDALSGAASKFEDKKLRDGHLNLKQAIMKLKTTAAGALAYAAQSNAGGQPYHFEARLSDALLIYEIRLLADGQVKKMRIDARTLVEFDQAAAPPPAAVGQTDPATSPETNAPPPSETASPQTAAPVESAPANQATGGQSGSAAGTGQSASSPEAKVWNFNGDAAGAVPAGWSIRQTQPTEAMAAWAVVADEKAPSPPNVFALTESKNSNGTFNLAIAEGAMPADLDLSVKVKAVGGKEDQGGGPIWRCRDENNYYVCRFNPLEGNFRVYRVIDGKRKQLETAKVETAAERWYTVRVTMSGEKLACWLDDQKLLEASDDALKDAGRVGLWTKADAATAFDDLTVKTLGGKAGGPAVPPTQPPADAADQAPATAVPAPAAAVSVADAAAVAKGLKWDKGVPWVNYRAGLPEALAAAGHTVLVDFGARWCNTCTVNRQHVLESVEVVDAMKRGGVVPVSVDFTDRNALILDAIKRHGRENVPLTLVYRAGQAGKPVVLPEALTRESVLEHLR